MNVEKQDLHLRIDSFPSKPGVYMFKDIDDRIVYIGKAKNLRKRAKSYFVKSTNDRKNKRIQEISVDIDFITTNTETGALILENSLIKIHKPSLNVRLKDDKTYPFLKIYTSEEIPRVEIVRKREEDNNLYFGPFTDVKSLRSALKKALTIFPIARCKKPITYGDAERSCLYFQLDRCLAPCSKKIEIEKYMKAVEQFIKLFEGRQKELLEEIKTEMEIASSNLDYERAALLRDKYLILGKIVEKQTIISSNKSAEYDILGIEITDRFGLVQILALRNGRIVEQKHFIINLPYESLEKEILAAFVQQYYSKTNFVPRNVLVRIKLSDHDIINEWLNERKGIDINFKTLIEPASEEEKAFIELAYENAKSNLNTSIRMENIKTNRITKSLNELKEILALEAIPIRIEGYDISTLQGKDTVGSCVVFEKGVPKKSDYRKFIIKTVKIQDDFASLREVIRRRFTGSLAKKENRPDLLLIDGGKGQVSNVAEELNNISIKIPIIGLSKELEEIHFSDERESVILNERSEALKLLQRIRDEAHRFAVNFHRKRRTKTMIKSSLEEISEIGPKKIENLLVRFGNIKSIKEASVEELESVPGISNRLAKRIRDYYRNSFIFD